MAIKPSAHLNATERERLKELEEKEAREEAERQNPSHASFEWPIKFNENQRLQIGRGLAKAREDAQLSQEKLGKLIGVAASLISRFENGVHVSINKSDIKKIGHILRNDFNELIYNVCFKKSAIASPDDLICEEQQTYRAKSADFDISADVSSDSFSLYFMVEGVKVKVYEGRRSRDNMFLKGVDKIIGMIRRGM